MITTTTTSKKKTNARVFDITRIPISEICMDKYQRPVNMGRVNRIVREFNEDRMRPIELSFRDGKYWCFDGQHRYTAFKQMGIIDIPAQIHYNLTYQQEAALFAEQHKNEAHIQKRDEWAARLEAGRECIDAMEINAVAKEFGYKVSFDAKDRSANKIGCVNVLQKTYARHGVNGLQTMFFVTSTAWPGIHGATHADILGGLLKIMDTYNVMYGGRQSDTFWNRLRNRMASTTPAKLRQKALIYPKGGSTAMAYAMITMYNAYMGEKNRMDINRIK